MSFDPYQQRAMAARVNAATRPQSGFPVRLSEDVCWKAVKSTDTANALWYCWYCDAVGCRNEWGRCWNCGSGPKPTEPGRNPEAEERWEGVPCTCKGEKRSPVAALLKESDERDPFYPSNPYVERSRLRAALEQQAKLWREEAAAYKWGEHCGYYTGSALRRCASDLLGTPEDAGQ